MYTRSRSTPSSSNSLTCACPRGFEVWRSESGGEGTAVKGFGPGGAARCYWIWLLHPGVERGGLRKLDLREPDPLRHLRVCGDRQP